MKSLLSVLLIVTVLALDEGLAQGQQPAKIPRIGVLANGSASRPGNQQSRTELTKGLEELGYINGKNIIIEFRNAEGNRKLLPDLVAELIRLKVSVIIPTGPTAMRPTMKATKEIPIVIVAGSPARWGWVTSRARPGGNITGLSSYVKGLVGKQMELLKEALPRVDRVAILKPLRRRRSIPDYQRAAQALGIELRPVDVPSRKDFDNAFTEITTMRPDVLISLRSTLTLGYARQIAQFALKNRIPLFADEEYFVESGGLMSYGVDFLGNWRRAAIYVDKILKGANPAFLPIEPPNLKFVLNLKTARKIGVTIPPEILLEANEIIR